MCSIAYTITDKYGKIRNEYWYDAFGNVLDIREQIHNRITYTEQQFDGITQQYYLRARFYNPVVGRFTQEDVYRGDGLNLYAYCGNNPVRYYDPSGYRRATEIDSNKVNDQNVMNIISKYTKGTNILPTQQSDVEKFFDNMSKEEFRTVFSNREVKKQIKDRFRAGEVHEWFKVSHLDIYKNWGMKANEIFSAVTPTKNTKFLGIETKNGIENGIHGNNSASSMGHRAMDKMILSSPNKQTYVDKLFKWSEKHFAFISEENGKIIKKGSEALPKYFHDAINTNGKQEKPKKCRG